MERVLCHSVQDVQRPTEGNQSIGWLHMREERERDNTEWKEMVAVARERWRRPRQADYHQQMEQAPVIK